MSLHVPSDLSSQLFTPFESLLKRVFLQVNKSASQNCRQTIIARRADESAEDWDRVLDLLDVEENVRVMRIEKGSAHLSWTNHHPS